MFLAATGDYRSTSNELGKIGLHCSKLELSRYIIRTHDCGYEVNHAVCEENRKCQLFLTLAYVIAVIRVIFVRALVIVRNLRD